MWKALVRKELRENAGIAAVGLVAMLVITGLAVRLPLWLFVPANVTVDMYGAEIPFVSDSFEFRYLAAAAVLALVLGFHQSMGDSRGSVFLFLLHRPVTRSTLIAAKLLVGASIFMILTIGPLLVYALWAATPGTHASPFAWSMTLPNLVNGQIMLVIYLGAFLSGIRPARWLGTRLAPFAAAVAFVAIALGLSHSSLEGLWLGVVLGGVAAVLLNSVILSVTQRRDYA